MNPGRLGLTTVKRTALDSLAVCGVGTLAYANTFRSPFTFDDIHTLFLSEPVRDLGMAVRELPLAPRAVGRLSFSINHALHGFEVTGFHVTNLVIHLLAALCVYALARVAWRSAAGAETGEGSRAVALTAALLFVSHPVQTQAVTYVVQRYASLAALLYAAALTAYATSLAAAPGARKVASYLSSLLLSLLAMRTKETALTLPIAIALYDVLFTRAAPAWRLKRLAPHLALLAVVPLVAMNAASGGAPVHSAALDTVSRDAAAIGRGEYLLTQARVIVTYLRLLVFPVRQNLDYDYPLHTTLDGEVILSAALLAGIVGGGAWLIALGRRRGAPAPLVAGFGVMLFFLGLAVESSVIPIADVIMEHRLYLPSMGAFLAVGAGAGALLQHERTRAGARRLLPALVGAVVLVLAGATWARNDVWRSGVSLWADTVAKSPGKLRPILNLRTALREAGDREASIQLASRAVALAPKDSEELYGLGLAWRDLGNVDAAEQMWTEALRARPNHALSLVSLGNLAYDRGDPASALELFRRAVDADPLLAIAHLKLAIVLDQAGDRADATQHFEAFVRTAPPQAAADARMIEQLLMTRRSELQ